MRTSDSIVEITKALVKVQAKLNAAKKDKENTFIHSKYADLASIWDVCREPLTQNNLAVAQGFHEVESGIVLVTKLMHNSGEWIESTLKMPVVRNDPQGVGSAITYARRYALSALVGVVTEDDDGEKAMGHIPQAPVQAAAPIPTTSPATPPSDAIPSSITAQIWQDYLELCGGQQDHALRAIMKITNGRNSANLTPADVFALQNDIRARRATKTPDVGSLREDSAFIAAEQAIQNAAQEAANGF